MATLLGRLASLATQRTARTDRLAEATQTLLAQLEKFVGAHESAMLANGRILTRTSVCTNVGLSHGWSYESPTHGGEWGTCAIDRPVGGEGYVHGDFRCAWRGPSRAELVDFASHSVALVESFVSDFERESAALASAAANVAQASNLASEVRP